MTKKTLFTHTLAFTALVIPALALAHGGVEDGHVEEVVADAPKAGASALLIPMSAQWFGLLAVSSVITALLCYWVYHYLQVPPVESKNEAVPEKK